MFAERFLRRFVEVQSILTPKPSNGAAGRQRTGGTGCDEIQAASHSCRMGGGGLS